MQPREFLDSVNKVNLLHIGQDATETCTCLIISHKETITSQRCRHQLSGPKTETISAKGVFFFSGTRTWLVLTRAKCAKMTVYSKTADTRPTAGLLDEWMAEWYDRQADSSVHRNIDQHDVIRTQVPELHPSKGMKTYHSLEAPRRCNH